MVLIILIAIWSLSLSGAVMRIITTCRPSLFTPFNFWVAVFTKLAAMLITLIGAACTNFHLETIPGIPIWCIKATGLLFVYNYLTLILCAVDEPQE
jgi:hypothetical protein